MVVLQIHIRTSDTLEVIGTVAPALEMLAYHLEALLRSKTSHKCCRGASSSMGVWPTGWNSYQIRVIFETYLNCNIGCAFRYRYRYYRYRNHCFLRVEFETNYLGLGWSLLQSELPLSSRATPLHSRYLHVDLWVRAPEISGVVTKCPLAPVRNSLVSLRMMLLATWKMALLTKLMLLLPGM